MTGEPSIEPRTLVPAVSPLTRVYVEVRWPGRFSSRFPAPPRGRKMHAGDCRSHRVVIAPNPSETLPLNRESASIFPILAITKVLPASLSSARGPVDWSSQLPSPRPHGGSGPGRTPSSLTPQGPAASPASATLGPGHCRRLCGGAAIRRTLAEHLLPGAGTASCVRGKAFPLPLPGQHACVRSGDIGGEEADAEF